MLAMTRPRVLVVDDDEDMRRLLSDLLHPAGCEVFVAENGQEALEHITGGTPALDLVVSDINMPGMSGLELLATIRLLDPLLRVILVERVLR